MGLRTDLQTLLEALLGTDAVYFQPPPSLSMKYPCIIYKLSKRGAQFANNHPYRHTKRYTLTVIDANPDSLIPDKVAALSQCSHETRYVADNLNHDVFNIYF